MFFIIRSFVLLAMVAMFLTGCGSLNYNQAAINATTFSPQTTVLLPVKMQDGYDTAGEQVHNILTDVLSTSGVFGVVIDPATSRNQMATNKNLSDAVSAYLTKLSITGVSDTVLSRKIGEEYRSDTIIVVDVTRFGFLSVDGEKSAEVSLGIKVIDVASGAVYWKAAHTDIASYRFFAPNLAEMARGIMKNILSHAPITKK